MHKLVVASMGKCHRLSLLCKNTFICSKQLYLPLQSNLTADKLTLDLLEDSLCSPDSLVNVFFCMSNACEACLILTGCHVDALLQLHEGYLSDSLDLSSVSSQLGLLTIQGEMLHLQDWHLKSQAWRLHQLTLRMLLSSEVYVKGLHSFLHHEGMGQLRGSDLTMPLWKRPNFFRST